MPLWTLNEIVAATGGKALACKLDAFGGVSIDSRDLSVGDLFVAIAGDRFDGHDFVEAAIKNGAGAALVGAIWAKKAPKDLPLIVVDDPLIGLEHLARAARARTDAKVVAVTGSVGKTSTKEAIRLVLEAAGHTHASIKSFNNHWGVPLMLARMPADTQYAVFEVGMNHANEIRPLVNMIRPHVAVVTNVGAAHLENFEDIFGIAAAKAEIFEALEPDGAAILGVDHEYVEPLRARALALGITNIVTFGRSAAADYRLENVSPTDLGMSGRVLSRKGVFDVLVPQFGIHALVNGGACFAVAGQLGVDLNQVATALRDFEAPPGRGNVVKLVIGTGDVVLLDESFNANPVSMRAALKILKNFPVSGRKVGVLGDMLELGETSGQLHIDLAQSVLDAGFEKLILVGPMMQGLAEVLAPKLEVAHYANAGNIADLLGEALAPGDVVMIKGSKGTKLSPVVEALRTRYSSI
jgi:UDP-N-acetylmuramoyl-tripeptide--D-alanyl-D-alanine ligase